jgi:hypothetical protein
MDFRNRRIWYVVAAIIVLIMIGYAAGWFDGEPVPPVIPE